MTEKTQVRLVFGQGRIPIQQIDGAREALQALFGFCPPFEADNERGVWLVELPAETAADLNAFGTLIIIAGIFTLTARKEK